MTQTNNCRGYTTCDRPAEPGDDVCCSCAEDGFGSNRECPNCGAPGGGNSHLSLCDPDSYDSRLELD